VTEHLEIFSVSLLFVRSAQWQNLFTVRAWWFVAALSFVLGAECSVSWLGVQEAASPIAPCPTEACVVLQQTRRCDPEEANDEDQVKNSSEQR
jgi:hypothetical protein